MRVRRARHLRHEEREREREDRVGDGDGRGHARSCAPRCEGTSGRSRMKIVRYWSSVHVWTISAVNESIVQNDDASIAPSEAA